MLGMSGMMSSLYFLHIWGLYNSSAYWFIDMISDWFMEANYGIHKLLTLITHTKELKTM